MDFTVLMSNDLELGSFDDICHPTNTAPEMLIVERTGDVLRISDATKIDLGRLRSIELTKTLGSLKTEQQRLESMRQVVEDRLKDLQGDT
jgi:hypothetical protein